MDQYFEKIDQRSQSTKYPPRIRFMYVYVSTIASAVGSRSVQNLIGFFLRCPTLRLRDLIELRRNGWVPRKSAITEAPVPMQQLRPDDNDPPMMYVVHMFFWCHLEHIFFSNLNFFFFLLNCSKREQRNMDRDNDSWMSKTQFNYQPNSNYNSSLIMNNIFHKNSNSVFPKYPSVILLLFFFVSFSSCVSCQLSSNYKAAHSFIFMRLSNLGIRNGNEFGN